MIDNYYYLRQEYTRCRISKCSAGGDIIRESIKPHRGDSCIRSGYGSLFLRAILRANYLITAASQSSGLIESSLFSGHHCDEFAPPVVIANYARFNFLNTMNC